MARSPKPLITVLFNHVGEDVYEQIKDVDPDTLDFVPEYDLDVSTVMEEYSAVVLGLRSAGFRARAVNVKNDIRVLERVLKRTKPDAVFNLVEHFHDDAELETNVAAMFELYGVAYTGASPFTLSLCQKKGLTKKVLLGAGVPTPRFLLLPDNRVGRNHGLEYPLMVKPAREDASSGVEKGSVVHTYAALRKRVGYVFEEWGPPILVEEFIDGMELHVGLLGNEEPEVLPPIEWDFSQLPDDFPPLISYSAKWDPLQEEYHKVHSVCPARISKKSFARVAEVALRAYEITECRDYARLDIRLGADGTPYVLEVNPNPDLTEGVSFMESAEEAGYDFEDTLGMIAGWAVQRKRPVGT